MYRKYETTNEPYLLEYEDDEKLHIIDEIIEKGRSIRNFDDTFAEKAFSILVNEGKLPGAIYNSLINIYYSFRMDLVSKENFNVD